MVDCARIDRWGAACRIRCRVRSHSAVLSRAQAGAMRAQAGAMQVGTCVGRGRMIASAIAIHERALDMRRTDGVRLDLSPTRCGWGRRDLSHAVRSDVTGAVAASRAGPRTWPDPPSSRPRLGANMAQTGQIGTRHLRTGQIWSSGVQFRRVTNMVCPVWKSNGWICPVCNASLYCELGGFGRSTCWIQRIPS